MRKLFPYAVLVAFVAAAWYVMRNQPQTGDIPISGTGDVVGPNPVQPSQGFFSSVWSDLKSIGSFLTSPATGNFNQGIQGTPGQPITGGNSVARDTAENRAKDTFVLVRGDMNHASGAFAGGNIRANPALTIDAVEAWNGSKGFAFPLNIVAYLCANIFTELDAGFVMGVLNTENASFDPQRTRYESTVNDTSVGLMQIRVDTARWICSTEMQGMPDEDVIAILRDPVWNCAIGCKYLLYQTYRYNGGDLLNYQPLGAWVAAAYNAGSAIYNFQSKRFSNQDYVDSVAAKSLVGEWQ